MPRLALLLLSLLGCAVGLYTGPFAGEIWQPLLAADKSVDPSGKLTFVVALKLRNRGEMHDTLMRVSDPASKDYGKYLSLEELKARFGPTDEAIAEVESWLADALPNALVHVNVKGDMFMVSSTVAEVEQGLATKLQYHMHRFSDNTHPALRAVQPISVPEHLHEAISFVSLNSPVNNNVWSTGRTLRSKPEGVTTPDVADGAVTVEVGNKAIVMFFRATCAGGVPNVASPPCSTLNDVPKIAVTFQREDDVFAASTVRFPGTAVKCYEEDTEDECTGTTAPESCICQVLVNNVEQYVRQSLSVAGVFNDGSSQNFGSSGLFALTDVATAQFLYDLYRIPYGIRVEHGSDIGLPEFYHEYYSNSDLEMFTKLSGMPLQQVSPDRVVGTDTNDESEPGGEAQLDVEYAFAIAPDADLWFYSMADLNPYSPENEGFLAWLWFVGNQTDAPHVYSLSYADIEAAVFNASTPGAEEYAYRCDAEFMSMGLRGMSVIAGSGDDGVASFAIRTNKAWACQVARPNWPASSPYITSIGATQLTQQYLPFCQEMYATEEPVALPAQCSFVGEVMCSSTLGGVIESGGGFSDVYNREEYAPWQDAFVDKYLEVAGATPTTVGYFNKDGRGYPDISTYGSNYFVYLGGKVIRESGTSASTPVFAAMVTLWNDMRFAYGMPSMGFINPFLYSVATNHPEAYTDVTLGKNACSASRNLDAVVCCDEAFSAAAGWDAVTGLGTPKFDVIANLVISPDALFPAQGSMTDTIQNECHCKDGEDGDDSAQTAAIIALVVGFIGLVGGLGAIYIARARQY